MCRRDRVPSCAHLLAADELIVGAQVAEFAVVEALASEGAEGERRDERQREEEHEQARC